MCPNPSQLNVSVCCRNDEWCEPKPHLRSRGSTVHPSVVCQRIAKTNRACRATVPHLPERNAAHCAVEKIASGAIHHRKDKRKADDASNPPENLSLPGPSMWLIAHSTRRCLTISPATRPTRAHDCNREPRAGLDVQRIRHFRFICFWVVGYSSFEVEPS
jgi:hypothetical protein